MRHSTYDPFTWRIDELTALLGAPTGDDDPHRRQLEDELLIVSAEEIAHGRRHLTIIHGEPTDLAEEQDLNDLYDEVLAIASEATWHRLRGSLDRLHVTIDTLDAKGGAGFAHVADVVAKWANGCASRARIHIIAD